MQIKSIETQIRNDMYGQLECEGCGHTQKFVGYDDDNYHRNVIPKIKCKGCGKDSHELADQKVSEVAS